MIFCFRNTGIGIGVISSDQFTLHHSLPTSIFFNDKYACLINSICTVYYLCSSQVNKLKRIHSVLPLLRQIVYWISSRNYCTYQICFNVFNGSILHLFILFLTNLSENYETPEMFLSQTSIIVKYLRILITKVVNAKICLILRFWIKINRRGEITESLSNLLSSNYLISSLYDFSYKEDRDYLKIYW